MFVATFNKSTPKSPLPVSWSIIKTDLAPHCAETTQNCAQTTQNRAQTTQIILANLASEKLILSVLAWPSRSSFDTCLREDWMTCCRDKLKPSCWSYSLSTVNLYQFEQNAHVNVYQFCSPPIDSVGWTFQQHDGQIKFHCVFTKKFKCPGSNDVFYCKTTCFRRNSNNSCSFTKLHFFCIPGVAGLEHTGVD